jgi:hypothetical protein
MEERKLVFKGTWRSYQKRVLDGLPVYQRDKKLHIVAAPGAGKTTLGIEVIARINSPSLVLCPTNVIKNQWKQRILSSFLNEDDYDLVSTDLRRPGFVTISTYQALLAAFSGNDTEELSPHDDDGSTTPQPAGTVDRLRKEKADEVVGILRDANVSTLCLDEAHHLRNEWWKALMYLYDHLNPERLIALTATPPYDVDFVEWKRYQDLCGEIDEVVSIPELVKNGDLCPHQDFICFSPLRKKEIDVLLDFNQNVRTFIGILQSDSVLLDFLSKLSFFNAVGRDVEAIYEAPEFYVSVASLLNSAGYDIADSFLELFDTKQEDLPKFDFRRASVFINGFLEDSNNLFEEIEPKKEEYFSIANRLGLVSNKKVVLYGNSRIRRQIAGSLGKLDSIVDIVGLESSQLHGDLRMVVLADYIKLDDLACQSVGVVPILKRLKDAYGDRISIGVLCGSLIMLPAGKMGSFEKLLRDNDIPLDAVTFGRFGGDERYVRIVPKDGIRNSIVGLITSMFNVGDLTLLVGTQALLGEGWDAPSVNSLILSSTVSSFMLSNQTRGRAIRVDRYNPQKVSNIWHLATVDSNLLRSLYGGGMDDDIADFQLYNYDLEQLRVRFDGFEAPSYYGRHEIVSGIDRILNFDVATSPLKMEKLRRTTMEYAKNREQTRRWWKESLYTKAAKRQSGGSTTGVQTPPVSVKSLRYVSFKYEIITALTIALYTFFGILQGGINKTMLFVAFASMLVFLAVSIGVLLVKFLRTGTVAGVLKQIATVVFESMSSQGLLKTSLEKANLKVTDLNGQLFVDCAGLPVEENNLFVQALKEFLDPIDNPRYILIKRGRFGGWIKQTDYFSIPSVISQRRENVDVFKGLWSKYLGKCEIVYTRSVEGRKVLLRARKYAYSASKRPKSKRLSKWE